MAAELLRYSSGLTRLTNQALRKLKVEVDTACRGKFSAFFRPISRVITFEYNGNNFRIDVDIAHDNEARRQMGMGTNAPIYYAQLQSGTLTYATIIYPQDENLVQLSTLTDALKKSMEHQSFYTAIN